MSEERRGRRDKEVRRREGEDQEGERRREREDQEGGAEGGGRREEAQI